MHAIHRQQPRNHRQRPPFIQIDRLDLRASSVYEHSKDGPEVRHSCLHAVGPLDVALVLFFVNPVEFRMGKLRTAYTFFMCMFLSQEPTAISDYG
jgi:hypothetical protein